MAVDQLPRLTGVRSGSSQFLPQLCSFLRHLSHVHPATVALSATTLVFLVAVVDERTEPVRRFVLNTEATAEVDITALDAVDGLRRELTGRGIVSTLARVRQDLLDDLQAYGLSDSVGRDRIFLTLPTALAPYEAWCRER
jgi:MFS superfamily sulfate permease-like transporter